MNEYTQMIHDIIEKVNPSVYADSSIEFKKQLFIVSGLMLILGILLLFIDLIARRYFSTGGDKALSRTGWFFVGCSILFVVLWSHPYKKPIKDTLTDASKAQISEYVGHLSNDDYITL